MSTSPREWELETSARCGAAWLIQLLSGIQALLLFRARATGGRLFGPRANTAKRPLALLLVISIGAQLLGAPRGALAVSSQLRRYPYLTDVVESSATINWATDRSSSVGFVRWGQAGSESCAAHTTLATRTGIIVNQESEYQWKAKLQLTPGAQYCYRIYLGSGEEVDLLGSDRSPRFWTQLPTGSNEPFSFVVFGDWGAVDGSGQNSDQANVMREIASSGARFAVTTGDNAYPSGTQANYGDLVQVGPNLSGVFGPEFWTVAGATIPLFPAIGNHGLSSSTSSHPHLLNFPQDTAVTSSGGRYVKETFCCLNGTTFASYPSAWYAFDAGNARFYMLTASWDEGNPGMAEQYQNDYDNHWTPSGAQYQWLENDLATHPAALKFAFFHYPLYSDNTSEDSDTYLQGANSLEGLLGRYGVDIAFTGHAHIYQRNQPAPGGLVSYVTGGGGAKAVSVRACSAIDAYAIGWSYTMNGGTACGAADTPTSLAQVFHFLLVTVDGSRVTVAPTDSTGRTFDVQTYDFATPADDTPPTRPTGLSCGINAAHDVELDWNAATDDTQVRGYTIYRDDALLATVPATQLDYIDTEAAPETTYRYSVDAFDAQGNHSRPSAAVTCITPAFDTTAPSTPTDIRATLVGWSHVDLTWAAATDDTGVAGYIIRRNGVVLAIVDGATTYLSDETVQPGMTYRYTVNAFDRFGNDSQSSVAVIVKTPIVVLLPLIRGGEP